MYEFKIYFLLFIFYSFLGWLMEIVACSLLEKKLANRGFLIGPYCPIYGVGLLSVIFLLTPLKAYPFIVVILAIIVCSIIEYLTSYAMEKMFHARWWDYSHSRFNINGRIRLSNSIAFGVFAILFIYIVNPASYHLLETLPRLNINILFWKLLILFLIDNIISFKVVRSLNNLTVQLNKDNTEEIISKVKEVISDNVLVRRLLKSFPNIKLISNKIETKIKNIIEEIDEKFKNKR